MMKKISHPRMGFFLMCVTLALLAFSPLHIQAAKASQEMPAKKEVKLGLMLDHTNEHVDMLIHVLVDEIKKVVGEDATIHFKPSHLLINDYSYEKAVEQYNSLQADVDVIIALGFYNNLALRDMKEYPIPTITVGLMAREFTNLKTDRKTSGISNFSYLVQSHEMKKNIEFLQGVIGQGTIGFVYEAPLGRMHDFEEQVYSCFEGVEGMQPKLIPYVHVQDIIKQLDGVDGLLMGLAFTLPDKDIKILADTLIKRRIPSYTTRSVEDVKAGILATYSAEDDYVQAIRRLALMVESVVNGYNLKDYPIFIDYKEELTMNYATSELLNLGTTKGISSQVASLVGDLATTVNPEKLYDIKDIVAEMLANNLTLAASRKDVGISKKARQLAYTNYLPSLEVAGSYTYTDPDMAEASMGQSPEKQLAGNITLEQVIFSHQANKNIQAQSALERAEKENFTAEELDQINSVCELYFNTLILKENVRIMLSNTQLTRSNLRIAEQNYETGQAGKSDVLRLKSELAQNTQSAIEALTTLRQAYYQINIMLGKDPARRIDLVESSLDKNNIFYQHSFDMASRAVQEPTRRAALVDFFVRETISNSHSLRAMDFNIKAQKHNKDLYSWKRFLPTIALQGRYNHTFDRSGTGAASMNLGDFSMPSTPDGYYYVGLNASIPIFQGGSNKIKRQQAKMQVEQLRINKKHMELALQQQTRTNFLLLVDQITSIELSDVSLKAAEEGLDLATSAYTAGAITVTDLLESQNNFLAAKLGKNAAVFNYLIRMLNLQRSIGTFFFLNTKEENAEYAKELQKMTGFECEIPEQEKK